MNKREIPGSGEALPVIGCGTYIGFDKQPGSRGYETLPGVVASLFEAGGTLLDSSPMYGRAEQTTGEMLDRTRNRPKAFLATKVWIQGREAGVRQMEKSMERLGTGTMDLMQIHNLVDWRTHLQTLRAWKEDGRVRYIGITHYSSAAYDEVEAILQKEQLDFLQINYSMEDREAENRLLPLAADKGVAVLVNTPFGGGGQLRRLNAQVLPSWAAEIGCRTWAQVMLKFTLSHPAVTCVIPGTGSRLHMAENMEAGMGATVHPEIWRRRPAATSAR